MQTINSLEEKVKEFHLKGYCVLEAHLPVSVIENCRLAFLPVFQKYLEENRHIPNRGMHRHFLPMPFESPCFAPDFFFDAAILAIVKKLMGENIIADQWGCDVPVHGSTYQDIHVDYKRPLFPEIPDMVLPPYLVVVSFPLVDVHSENGAIELAPGTHMMKREQAIEEIQHGKIYLQPIYMNRGDVLIRHPWTLHRGSPNNTDTPRLLASIRYVRSWYSDNSREVNAIPQDIWRSLTEEQKKHLRFPVQNS